MMLACKSRNPRFSSMLSSYKKSVTLATSCYGYNTTIKFISTTKMYPSQKFALSNATIAQRAISHDRFLSYSTQSADEDEIERKFKPSRYVQSVVEDLAVTMKQKQFTDVYYDISGSYPLTTRDMWLRRRDNILELKWPMNIDVEAQTGMLNIDYYHETTDLRKVTEVIKKSTNGLVDIPLYKIKDDTDHFIELLHSFGFQSFARILTERSRYELYVRSIPYAKPVKESSATNLFHKVHVDIDQVKYLDVIDKATGRPAVYTIGEIELLQNCTNKSSGEVMKDIFHRLSIHPTSTIRGKVLEYLYRYQRHHYDILVESGLIGKKLGTINSTTDDIGDNATSEPNTEYKDLSPARELLQNTAVNIHFSRKCNYECNFCFHTAKSSDMLSINEWNQIISSLKKSGVEKLNFAGGEPFLQSHRKLLGEMIVSAKSMGIQSVSVITNASQMKYLSDWFQNYAKYLDILGVSLDTLSMDINKQHGRYPRGKINEIKLDDQSHLNNVRLAARICNDYGIKFKINTVVTSLNKDEDISSFINEIKPFRWKIFQVLPLQGENYGLTKPLSDKGTSCSDSKAKLRDVTDLLITDKEFQAYIDRHSATVYDPSIIKPESNDMMQSSYILIDEYGRFLDSSTGSKIPTDSILDIGINNASEQLLTSFGGGFNRKAFHERDGYYPNDWSK